MSDFNASLPVRTEAAGDVIVKLGDGTTPANQLAITASGEASVQVTQPLPAGTNNIGDVDIASALPAGTNNIGDVDIASPLPAGTNNIGDVDIVTEPATAADGAAGLPAVVKVIGGYDGANVQALSTDATGALKVTVVSESLSAGEVCNYDTSSAVAAAATDNHDYTVTAAKTLKLKQVMASASGRMKAEVQIETGVATDVYTTKATAFFDGASGGGMANFQFSQPIEVAAGVRVRVARTNRSNQAQDVYSTIIGDEV